MKTLKNSFTSPEQSKRLLSLGVPANSADLYSCLGFEKLVWVRRVESELREDFFNTLINGKSTNTPIWSVGRLIEIMKICSIPVTTWYIRIDSKQPVLEFLLNELEMSVIERDIDFSRLED